MKVVVQRWAGCGCARVARFAGCALFGLIAAAASAGVVPQGGLEIDLELAAGGLTAPVTVTHAGDGSGRIFIVEQRGQVLVWQNGALLPTPFLNIASLLPTLNNNFDERGLIGLAFHPQYATNGRFFVRYSSPRTGVAGEPCVGTSRGCHSEVLAEFRVSSADPNVADPTPIELFRVPKPQFNHNGGQIAFGPDGYLYVSLGDGGGANDGLADNPPSHGPIGNGQNIETLLGKILRIDVDGAMPYESPANNPFFGDVPGRDEIYAWGFRNPFQFSFDDGPGGDGALWCADVGQNLFEEIDLVVRGGNYGWVTMEGSRCFNPIQPNTPPATCDQTGLILPIAEYDHSGNGISIIGGHVYRGAASPALVGKYLFGDFGTSFGAPTGHLFYIDTAGPLSLIQRPQLGPDNHDLARFVKGSGEDEGGEVYICTSAVGGPSGTTGQVWRFFERRCAGDGFRDGVIDMKDLTATLSSFGANYLPGTGPGDADSSGIVNFGDITVTLTNYTVPCP